MAQFYRMEQQVHQLQAETQNMQAMESNINILLSQGLIKQQIGGGFTAVASFEEFQQLKQQKEDDINAANQIQQQMQ